MAIPLAIFRPAKEPSSDHSVCQRKPIAYVMTHPRHDLLRAVVLLVERYTVSMRVLLNEESLCRDRCTWRGRSACL